MYPYYVSAPRFVATSAGIRALYRLVDAINEAGGEAYILWLPFVEEAYLQPPEYRAPLLTPEIVAAHAAQGRKPIVVISETAEEPPLAATALVRFVMNTPGLLGGPQRYDGAEFLYGYGRRIAEELGVPDRALFVPVIDLDRFSSDDQSRTLTLYYAGKYRDVHKGVVFDVPDGAVEITRDQADSPSAEEILDLLRRAVRLYVFENTALAVEAPLCGCVTVMMPNPFLAYSIGEFDHGRDGIAWGNDPEEIARAERTVGRAAAAYQAVIDRFPEDLARFITLTQAFRDGVAGFGLEPALLKRPSYAELASAAVWRLIRSGHGGELVRKGLQVVRRDGLAVFARVLWSTGRRRDPRA